MITFERPATYSGVKICRVCENNVETDLEIRRYPGERTWSVWLGGWNDNGHQEYVFLAGDLTKREARKCLEKLTNKNVQRRIAEHYLLLGVGPMTVKDVLEEAMREA